MKVAFFGHFGSENFGNESTLIAILARLRDRFPEAAFMCICTNPRIVIARDAISAVPITTRAARPRGDGAGLTERARDVLASMTTELCELARAFRLLAGTDVLIVPGTGLVTDAFGLHGWGPASMFKWVLAAKLRGARVMLISIGAGPIYSRRGRLLVRAILSLADYRSYRDDASRRYLAGIGFPATADPVYPDLVFGLQSEPAPCRDAQSEGRRRVVGLGLMQYAGRYSSADPRPETADVYLESVAAFAEWLLESDYEVHLLLGDGDGDPQTINEFRAILSKRLGRDDERIVERPISSVPDLLAELASTDAVVATRFHNILMALLCGKPAVAISFHHKCAELMQQMQLSAYCLDIQTIDSETLVAQFQRLEQNRDEVKHAITDGITVARTALDEQYEALFPRP